MCFLRDFGNQVEHPEGLDCTCFSGTDGPHPVSPGDIHSWALHSEGIHDHAQCPPRDLTQKNSHYLNKFPFFQTSLQRVCCLDQSCIGVYSAHRDEGVLGSWASTMKFSGFWRRKTGSG